MAAAFTMLFAKIAAVLKWCGELYVKCWTAAWDILRDAACWPFEELMKILVSAVGGIDLASMNSQVASAGGLPAEIVNILSLLHVGACISIISAAIAIRIVLQLIPFTRLGS